MEFANLASRSHNFGRSHQQRLFFGQLILKQLADAGKIAVARVGARGGDLLSRPARGIGDRRTPGCWRAFVLGQCFEHRNCIGNLQVAERIADGVAHIGRWVLQGGQQRVEGTRVANFAQRRGGPVRDLRISVGQTMEQLVKRSAFANNSEYANRLNSHSRVGPFGQLKQRA